jgi:hypothetical protein
MHEGETEYGSVANDRATAQLENSAGEALIAIGLYSACFDAMTLAFKLKLRTHIQLHEPHVSLDDFDKSCRFSAGRFAYCGPRLVELGVISQADFDAVDELRDRRNKYVHESPYHILTLTLSDIDEDLRLMARITSDVQYWSISGSEETKMFPGMRASLHPEPSVVTNLVRRIARNLVEAHLRDDPARPRRRQVDT